MADIKSHLCPVQFLPSASFLFSWHCTQDHVFTNEVYVEKNFLKYNFTELKNALSWKGPLEIIQSNSSAKAGSPRAGYAGTCPGGFESLQRGRIHSFPGQLFQCCATLHAKFFLLVIWDYLHFIFLILETTEDSGTNFLVLAFEIFIYIDEILSQASLLQTNQAQISQSLLIRDVPVP